MFVGSVGGCFWLSFGGRYRTVLFGRFDPFYMLCSGLLDPQRVVWILSLLTAVDKFVLDLLTAVDGILTGYMKGERKR